MRTSIEQEEFSKRLQHALRKAGYPPESPTRLAREFNIRFSGGSITVHAARKWLAGESIPTQEKLRTLAQWLGVPAEWLRYGSSDGRHVDDGLSSPPMPFVSDDVKMIADLQALDQHYRAIAHEIIRLLLRLNRKH